MPATLSAIILRFLSFIWVKRSDIILFKKSVKVRIIGMDFELPVCFECTDIRVGDPSLALGMTELLGKTGGEEVAIRS